MTFAPIPSGLRRAKRVSGARSGDKPLEELVEGRRGGLGEVARELVRARRSAGARLHLGEDPLQALGGIGRVVADEAEVRPAVEHGREERRLADEGDLDAVALALVEERGEVRL